MTISAWWLFPAAMVGAVLGAGIIAAIGCGKRADDGIKDLARQDAPKKLVWLYPK